MWIFSGVFFSVCAVWITTSHFVLFTFVILWFHYYTMMIQINHDDDDDDDEYEQTGECSVHKIRKAD